jgi:DNA-binding MarR family transcriptional regulator
MPAGCWDLDLVTGSLALCPKSRRLFGLSPDSNERLSESEWTSRFHPDDLPPVRQALAASLSQRAPYAERFRTIHPDGTIRVVFGIGQPLERGDAGARFVGWNFDVVSTGEMAAEWISAHPEALNSEHLLAMQPIEEAQNASKELSSETLLERAQSILRVRRGRERLLGRGAIGDPAFDLLLCLYVRPAQTETSVTNLASAANTPYSSAIRWIQYLGDKGLVERRESKADRRSTLVQLTRLGRAVLDELFSLR